MMNFNSHAHVERDERRNLIRREISYFNSHAHVERDVFRGIFNTSFLNFNSHAHVERDNLAFYVTKYITISTHTLTWSVTDTLI